MLVKEEPGEHDRKVCPCKHHEEMGVFVEA
jgi:hypothetical protein